MQYLLSTPHTNVVSIIALHEFTLTFTNGRDDVDTCDRSTRTPCLYHRRRLPHPLSQGWAGHERFHAGWLQYRLETRPRALRTRPETLLDTYSGERQEIAKNLIDFDKEWSTLMVTKPEDLPSPEHLEEFYVKTAEFPAGFMTEYKPSLLTGSTEHQHLAEGFPVGKRFRSARVNRRENAYPRHLGHEAMADGRYRLYVFADAARPGVRRL